MEITNRGFIFFLLLCRLISGESCSLSVSIGGDNCEDTNLCTILQGFNECVNMYDEECTNGAIPASVLCIIQVESSELTGENNTNIVFSQATRITQLRIIFGGDVIIGEGFFVNIIHNALDSFELVGNPKLTIRDSTETAIQFISQSSESILDFSLVTFSNCSAVESAGALFIDSPGTISLGNVIFTNTQSAGDCGALKLQVYPTTQIMDTYPSTFTDSVAAGSGGGICVFGGPDVHILIPMPQFSSSTATLGGGMYIRGPGSFTVYNILQSPLVKATNGSLIYAEDFDDIQILQSNFGVSGNNTDNGIVYLTSSRDTATATVARIAMSGSNIAGNGGAFYFRNINNVTVKSTFFGGCRAPNGIGGVLLFDGVDEITVQDCEFDSNEAQTGAAMACIGGSGTTTVSDSTFIRSVSSISSVDVDIYSDGTCEDIFWSSMSPCSEMFSCSSCSTSVCGISTTECSCYCDSNSCGNNSPATSSPSPNASVSISVYESGVDSENSTGIGTGWIVFLVVLAVLIILAVVVVGIVIVFGRKQLSAAVLKSYDHIKTKSPDTPQREDDGTYQIPFDDE